MEKIAITAIGCNLDSNIDTRFGRASKFIICNDQDDNFEVIENNQNLNAMQGAGIQSAQTILDNNINVVITGHCGPKAFRVLQMAKVKVITGVNGTVRQALELYRTNQLKPANNADVQGHWS